MQIERHVERCRPLENRPEPLVVEKDAVGQPVDHRTLKAEPRYGAFELVRRRFRVGGRDRGKPGKAVGMSADGFMKPVVGAAREAHRGLGVHLLHAGVGVRQDLQVDAGGVHFGDAALSDIV